MDAAALLKSQGWRGKGFSLHPTNNDIGLSKPLLISRKIDGRGVGQKPHYTSDQWWLHAFDQKLKGLDTSGKGVVQSVTQGKLDAVAKCSGNSRYDGLYTSFVRGETMEGTITPDTAEESTDATPESQDRERPRIQRETKEERRARRAARRLKREEKSARKAAEAEAARKIAEKAAKEAKRAKETVGTKAERRARKAKRRARKEARRKREAAFAISAGPNWS